MTDERLKQIRDWFTGNDKVTIYINNPRVMMSPEAYYGLHELFKEIDQLRERLNVAEESITHVLKYTEPGFDWDDLLRETLFKIRQV